MRTRNYNYYDAANNKPLFGFQVWHNGGWSGVIKDGKRLLFNTEKARDKSRTEYRKTKIETANEDGV